jgi:hypothetical protein
MGDCSRYLVVSGFEGQHHNASTALTHPVNKALQLVYTSLHTLTPPIMHTQTTKQEARLSIEQTPLFSKEEQHVHAIYNRK